MRNEWSYWKVAVKSFNRWRVWATFANPQDAEYFYDLTRKNNPSWQVRIVEPNQKLNPTSSVPLSTVSPSSAVRP